MSSGARTKCAFRIGKRSVSTYPASTTAAGTGAQTLSAGDLVPYSSESLAEEYQFEASKVLAGVGAPSDQILMGKLGGGRLTCPAHYLGLDQLIACALGWESFELSGVQSPAFTESVLGESAGDTVHSTSTTSRIVATSSGFFGEEDNLVVGEFVRASTPGSPSAITDSQVRRIISSSASGNYCDVTPAFSYVPSGRPFSIARAFLHQFECALDLAIEPFSYGEGSYYRARHGTLAIYKVVSSHEFRGVMVDSMTFRMTADEVTIEFDLVIFDLDLRTTGRNSSASGWSYSASPLAHQERLRLGDAVFRIGEFSGSSALGDSDKLGISSFELTLRNHLGTFRRTSSGLYRAEPSRDGFREVVGTFTVPKFTSESRLSDFRAGTTLMADLTFTGTAIPGVSATNSFAIYLRSLKLTKVNVSVGGAGVIEEKAEFACIPPASDPAGMPAQSTDADNSEVMIQIVNSNPFNAYMGQNAE